MTSWAIQGVNGGVVRWENLMELLLDFAMFDDTGTVFQLWGSLAFLGFSRWKWQV